MEQFDSRISCTTFISLGCFPLFWGLGLYTTANVQLTLIIIDIVVQHLNPN